MLAPHHPLFIKPRFSRKLASILILLHSSAGGLLWPLALPVTLKWAILGLIIYSLFDSVRYHLLFIHHPLKDCVLQYDRLALGEQQQEELLTQLPELLYFYTLFKYGYFIKKSTLIRQLKPQFPLIATLSTDSYCSISLIILRVSVQWRGSLEEPSCPLRGRKTPLTIEKNKVYSLVLFSDMLDPETFRLLRVRLQYPYQQPPSQGIQI